MWDFIQDKVVVIGCCVRIEDYQCLFDDWMKILIIGEKRFRVLDIVREKFYLVGLVELIEDVLLEKEFGELVY